MANWLENACRSALAAGLLKSTANAKLDRRGYVSAFHENVIAGVRLEDFEADLRQGDGKELEDKFCAPHSSSALAVNSFAPFKPEPQSLCLAQRQGFTSLSFERKCPTGLRGTPPHLDLVAEGPQGVVAVEAKCLEFVRDKRPSTGGRAQFSEAYDAGILDYRRGTRWFAHMHDLIKEPDAYQRLDAAQLIKHAFGLMHSFSDRPVTLLYLFWEPANPDVSPIFQDHRNEVRQFAEMVSGDGPDFVAMSYPELWRIWVSIAGPDWITKHVHRLRERYAVDVSNGD